MSSSPSNGSGITFGNYEVVAKDDGTPVLLGGGSYGKTYRAVHSFLGSTVALKVVHDSFAFDAGVKKRFLTEAKAMARLRHPHVAQILNCGEEDGTLYYAVEYCDGGDLEHVVRKVGPLKPGTVLALARQAAEALAYVHENGFLHRDLKPSNLMLATPQEGGDARLKVIDFGLVKQFDQGLTSVMTQTGQFLGTMLFASPEQLREEPLDARSDIFSLGLTLWFMLKGGTPFAGKPAQVVAQRLSGKGYTADLPPNLPQPLHSLLARMVAVDVQSRPASMREVLQAIDDSTRQMMQPESPLAQLTSVADTEGPAPDPDEDAFSGMSIHLTSVERLTGDCYALDSEQMEVDFGVRHRGRRLPSGKVVALTLVRRSLAASPAFVQHLERTVLRASECAGSQLIRPIELVRFRDHLVLVEEWVQGLDLLTLLRQRKTISLAEALPIARQLADACDLARTAQLSKLEIAAHRVILQFEKLPWTQLDAAAQTQLLSQPLQQWPPFTVRIAPTYTIEEKVTGPSTMSQMPQLTVVGGGEQDADLASRYGRLIYRIVSGHPALATATISRSAYVSVAGLTEESNQFLSQVIAGEAHHDDCLSILEDLWRLERLSPAAFRGSAGTSSTGTSRPGNTRSSGTLVPKRGAPPPVRSGSPSPAKVSTVPVTPIEPSAAAKVPAWDLKDAKPVATDGRPRIVPLGKKPPPPLSTPTSQKPTIASRPPKVLPPKPQPRAVGDAEFWGSPNPVATPTPAPAPQRKFPVLPVALASVGLLAVIGGIFLLNRPAPEEEYDEYAEDTKRPILRPTESRTQDETPKPIVQTVPSAPIAPPPTQAPAPVTPIQSPAPVPAPATMPAAVAATPSSTPAPQPELPKPATPAVEAPKPMAAPVVVATPPPAVPPPPVDPIVELEKRYQATQSRANAQQLATLLESKLTTAPLADRAKLAGRVADLWRVTRDDESTLEWTLYQHYRKHGLNAEADKALTNARNAAIKEAWVETIRALPPTAPDMLKAQQYMVEAWPTEPEGKTAIQWLQTHVEARIPTTAPMGQVEDPIQPGKLLTIPTEQWKPGGPIALPEFKRYFRLPYTLPKPRVELARAGDGRIQPGSIKSPTDGRRLDGQWGSWRAGATIKIDNQSFQMPDDVPAPELEASDANGTAHTVRSPYGGHVVRLAESDWQAGSLVTDSTYPHLRFRLPAGLPEWFDVKEAFPIEGRYTAVKSPYTQGNEIPVTSSAWASGETVDPVTRQKVKMPRITDPKPIAEVIDAYTKSVKNPYTQTQETWKGTWEAGASVKWGGSSLTYRLPTPLPSAEVQPADFLSFTSVRNPYTKEAVTVTESDWSAGVITPKKGRPMKMPAQEDPEKEVRILDIGERLVLNPYTQAQFVWPGQFVPKESAKWGPFTMKLPSSKSAFKEQITVPNSMRNGFKASNGIWLGWRRDGYWRSDPITVGGDMAETCRFVTEYAHQNQKIPLDHEIVFDGKDRLISRRIKPATTGTVQANR